MGFETTSHTVHALDTSLDNKAVPMGFETQANLFVA